VVYLEAELHERNSLVVLVLAAAQTWFMLSIVSPAGLWQLESSIRLLGSSIRLQVLSSHIIGGIRG
jgi:hypothetical protein